MTRFIQENYALVAGIALPLALMLLFLIAGKTAEVTVADPQHDVIFIGDHYEGPNNPYTVAMENGKLAIHVKPVESNQAYHTPVPRLYRFDHVTKTSSPIAIDYTRVENGVVKDADIDALNEKTLSTDVLSPDGYRFEYFYRSNGGGIAGEFFNFGRNYHGSDYALIKKPRAVPLKPDQPVYQAKFLAWVL